MFNGNAAAAGRRPDVVGLEDMIARTYPPENALMPGIHCRGLVSISRWPAWECRVDHVWGRLFVVAWLAEIGVGRHLKACAQRRLPFESESRTIFGFWDSCFSLRSRWREGVVVCGVCPVEKGPGAVGARETGRLDTWLIVFGDRFAYVSGTAGQGAIHSLHGD